MDNNTNIENNVNNQIIPNNDQKDKKDSGKVGIIVALIILLASAVGFICYDKFINTEKPPVPTPTPTVSPSPVPTDNTETEYAEWMKYILEQDITKIEVSKVPCSEDTFEKKTVVLNMEQLKNTFKKFMNYKLKLTYSGGGGWQCGESLKITYLKDGQEYWIEYLGTEGHLSPSSDGCHKLNDKDLEKVLNGSLDEIENEAEKDNENMCLMYSIVTNNYLLDEYFN